MSDNSTRKKIIALTTAVLSILIGLVYLLLIAALDFRGQMIPPPPEAFDEVATLVVFSEFEAL